jgi:bacillithiol system protein YtxJ
MQTSFRAFESPAAFEQFLAGGERAFIFKHSTQCGASQGAEEEFEDFAAGGGIPIYRVLVIESRPLSNAIAARLGVAHRSPQAILVEKGKVIWSASHRIITARALRDAWANAG